MDQACDGPEGIIIVASGGGTTDGSFVRGVSRGSGETIWEQKLHDYIAVYWNEQVRGAKGSHTLPHHVSDVISTTHTDLIELHFVAKLNVLAVGAGKCLSFYDAR